MSNPIHKFVKIGTLGELLVQLRLLQYNVQAAPPIKDSGNDLIAIKGLVFKTIQVKTSTTDNFRIQNLPSFYHILALVRLVGENNNIFLDNSRIFLLSKEEVTRSSFNINNLMEKELNETRINELFY
ncbi:MAG: hypothetical protein O8C64_12100 [Candidatus Methanoperedens sp.]|nr:hypothetical protein [Candidatus Methanoperedens sp.]MCZ7384454.1 hypothetical protein [Candidatus Methanoperedens sp.]MCZ7403326.1 hypothetical protein [Candidatus Methanoperedens sp.]